MIRDFVFVVRGQDDTDGPRRFYKDIDDVFYLFLQKQKIGAELHTYLEEGTYLKRLFRGPSTNDMKKYASRMVLASPCALPTPHTTRVHPLLPPPQRPGPTPPKLHPRQAAAAAAGGDGAT